LHSSGHQTSDVITGKKESQELPDVKKGLERDLGAEIANNELCSSRPCKNYLQSSLMAS
jgi:hypothetical protein